MEDFALFMSSVVRFLNIEINIYGFSFTLWHMLIFDILAGICGYVLFGVFKD